MAKARDFKFCLVVRLTVSKLSLEWAWSWSRDVFKFSEISDNISESVHDRDIITMKDKYEIIYGLSNCMIADDMTLSELDVVRNLVMPITHK